MRLLLAVNFLYKKSISESVCYSISLVISIRVAAAQRSYRRPASPVGYASEASWTGEAVPEIRKLDGEAVAGGVVRCHADGKLPATDNSCQNS
jgi:hypothetical protein